MPPHVPSSHQVDSLSIPFCLIAVMESFTSRSFFRFKRLVAWGINQGIKNMVVTKLCANLGLTELGFWVSLCACISQTLVLKADFYIDSTSTPIEYMYPYARCEFYAFVVHWNVFPQVNWCYFGVRYFYMFFSWDCNFLWSSNSVALTRNNDSYDISSRFWTAAHKWSWLDVDG